MEVERISITICGDGGCGKSSITLRLVRSQWTQDYDPTIEDSYSVTRQIDGLTYSLSLTDTAGQEEYRGLWASSNLKSDAFLLVYDITSPASLLALEHFISLIAMESETRTDAGAAPPVLIVAGNKCDLAHLRQVKSVQGLEWARRHGCGFMETSAREVVNIEETFAREVAEQRRLVARGMGGPRFENGAVSQTAPLSPLSEKERAAGYGAPAGVGGRWQRVRMRCRAGWQRLRCW
ncbi:MAG: hypothetical protein M1829_001381 [Trizodia sp. TS-e1964]|nr:MAG: hypothetical protein M1829_001381 [Trizodia sp. TS-e1964]